MDIKESWLLNHPKLYDVIGTPSILLAHPHCPYCLTARLSQITFISIAAGFVLGEELILPIKCKLSTKNDIGEISRHSTFQVYLSSYELTV